MGGKSSKQVTTTDIQTHIETEIKNETMNMTKIINETITTTTMNAVNEIAMEIETKINAGNTLQVADMTADGAGSVIDINQAITVESISKSIANIQQDAGAIAKLASQMTNDVSNKLTNDSAAQASMKQVAALNEAKSTAGGLNDMLANVTNMMTSVLTQGVPCDKKNETKIKTSMKISILNRTVNNTDIANIIKNNFNSNVTQKTLGSCKIDISATNMIKANNMTATNGGKISVKQNAEVKSLSNCIIGAVQTSKLIQDITTGTTNANKSDTSNKNSASGSMDSTTTITRKEVTEDGFGKMISNFSPAGIIGALGSGGIICIGGCIFICVILIIVYMVYTSSQSSEPTGSTESTESSN